MSQLAFMLEIKIGGECVCASGVELSPDECIYEYVFTSADPDTDEDLDIEIRYMFCKQTCI